MITDIRLAALTANYKLATDAELDELANLLHWKSFGPDNNQGQKVNLLCRLDTDHIACILVDQHHLGNLFRKVLLHIYTKRLASIDIQSSQNSIKDIKHPI